jgi:hypothetical protein
MYSTYILHPSNMNLYIDLFRTVSTNPHYVSHIGWAVYIDIFQLTESSLLGPLEP